MKGSGLRKTNATTASPAARHGSAPRPVTVSVPDNYREADEAIPSAAADPENDTRANGGHPETTLSRPKAAGSRHLWLPQRRIVCQEFEKLTTDWQSFIQARSQRAPMLDETPRCDASSSLSRDNPWRKPCRARSCRQEATPIRPEERASTEARRRQAEQEKKGAFPGND